jgi:hypothetical protein
VALPTVEATGLVGIVAAGELLADPDTSEPLPLLRVRQSALGARSGAELPGPRRSPDGSLTVRSRVAAACVAGAAGRRRAPAPAAAVEGGQADPEPGAPGGRRPAARRSPIRLTRRGRVVIMAILVLLAAAIAALAAIPSQAAAPAAPPRVVVVHPGESLWTIVERYHAGADSVRAVKELRAVNHLAGSTVYPGEELTLPPRW